MKKFNTTDFDIDMSLSEPGIQGMLEEYEADHHTGMDTRAVTGQIREYTNGYPYLERFDLNTGYMLSFNFNQKKKTGVERVVIGDKVLFEGTV